MVEIGTAWIRDFSPKEHGNGSIDFTSDYSVKINSSTSDSTYIYKYIRCQPQEEIFVSFKAKVKTGEMGVAIDYPSTGEVKNSIEITSKSWQEYTLRYTVPITADRSEFVKVSIGQYGNHGGECEVSDVKIYVSNSGDSFARINNMALIKIASGTATISTNFSFVGINPTNLGNATTSLKIYVKPTGRSSIRNAPIFNVSLTKDNSNSYKVIAKCGSYNKTTGELTIIFIDSTSGNLVDISSLGTMYLWIMGLSI